MAASRSKSAVASDSASRLLSPFLPSGRDSTVSSLMASQENLSFTSSIRQTEPELWRRLQSDAQESSSPGHLSRLMEEATTASQLRRTASAALEGLREEPSAAKPQSQSQSRRRRQESVI